ncbi:hypothetical protein ACLOJK_031502 [Asimina triloba]
MIDDTTGGQTAARRPGSSAFTPFVSDRQLLAVNGRRTGGGRKLDDGSDAKQLTDSGESPGRTRQARAGGRGRAVAGGCGRAVEGQAGRGRGPSVVAVDVGAYAGYRRAECGLEQAEAGCERDGCT